jgi:hypothetical protein
MTILEEYNKSDKIKTFHSLLSSIVSLVILKNYFKFKKKKDEIEKNNSYYENYERTSIKNNGLRQLINMNLPDKYMILSSMKKSSKLLFSDLIEEKRISPKKLSSVNTTGFNLKTTKNANKKNEISILSKPNYFVKTGIGYNYNKSNAGSNILLRESLRTHSFKENDKQKDQQKNIAKSKTHSKYPQIKSSSGNILINNLNLNKEAKNDSNNTLQYNSSSKKNNNSVVMKINSGNKNNNNIGRNNNNKVFLKKHIVIESKNKNMANDNRKNNNSINSNNNKNNNADGKQ